MVAEAVAHGDVIEVFHTSPLAGVVGGLALKVPVTVVSDAVMARMSDAATPSGVLAVVRTPETSAPLAPSGGLLVLDRVGDPGNVGTLIRTATALGVGVVSIGGADPFGPKAVRASAGSCYQATIHRADDAAPLRASLRGDGRPVLGLAADGEVPLAAAAAELPACGVVLVVGSEPSGLSAPMAAAVDRHVRIPMAAGIESLNVAAAGAIALYALMGA